MVGLKAALDFHQALGPDRVYARIRHLASRVRDRLKDYHQFRLANASSDAFYAGMVSFEPVKGVLKRVLAELAARNVSVAGNADRIRVTTHLHPADGTEPLPRRRRPRPEGVIDANERLGPETQKIFTHPVLCMERNESSELPGVIFALRRFGFRPWRGRTSLAGG